jgi:peptidoglycan hydrolase-like protein with peptidoglycan-binding domain
MTNYFITLLTRLFGIMSLNRTFTSCVIAFTIIMVFVSTNALFYQPFAHKDAFFKTRSMNTYQAPLLLEHSFQKSQDSSIFKITRDVLQEGDPKLKKVQSALTSIKLYNGTVDGLNGPKTRQAIIVFQQQIGLTPTGEVDPKLVDALLTQSIPFKKDSLSLDEVKKIQLGLKTFGNDDIDVDGKIGARTQKALIEFQTLFKLNITGVADRQTLQKLQELGFS